jgi:alpha-L-fucosidase 2
LFIVLLLNLFFLSCGTTETGKEPLKLWYRQPAVQWTEALPVGNGRLGAMVFGKTGTEQIQLNEESLWAGSRINNNNPEALRHLTEIRQMLFNGQITQALELSKQYLLGTPPNIRSYQTLGDLFITLEGDTSGILNYRRELDLNTGIATTVYEQQGVQYTREVFVSAPDNVIVILLKAKNGTINARLSLKREKDAETTATGESLEMKGQILDQDSPGSGPGGEHMRFAARMTARSQGGSIRAEGGSLIVRDAASLVLLLTAATDYNRDLLNFDRAINPVDICNRIIDQAEGKPYGELRTSHIADHQALFNRVDFSICGEEADTIPTNERLRQVRKGREDLHLTELYFQYGRYLLMGSSRAPGILPANLQGIWNNYLEAPWNSDFHTNINLQMNYWLADVCNLPETLDPLSDFFVKLMEPGGITARDMYGCRGWTMHHVTDPFGRTGLMDGIQWGTFPMAGPWMSLHFWDHFCYTGDTAYLKETAWPIMKGSALFVLDFLTADKKGQWVTAPSYSPENAYYLPGTKTPMQLTYGATMDIQIAREVFTACIKASKMMHESPAFADSLLKAIAKLPPTRVGKSGTIMEWIEDYEEAEPGHRHISHLFGLHPGTQITPETTELFQAAGKTIEHRLASGGGHTGWSRAWIVNFYARLLEGGEAHTHLQALLGKSTLPNLFDTHPPFQIDGNFGGTAGIAEMLLQSHNGFIHVLPALPPSWQAGSIKGLKARGNLQVDIAWAEGKLKLLTIKAYENQPCKIRYHSENLDFKAEKGITYIFGPDLVPVGK